MPFTQSHFFKQVAKVAVGHPSVRKATAAFYGPVAFGLGKAMSDGNLTGGEVLTSLGSGLVASALAYGFRNK